MSDDLHNTDLFSEPRRPSLEEMFRYLDGTLSQEERHAIEADMLEDPLLADAMEGLGMLEEDREDITGMLGEAEGQFMLLLNDRQNAEPEPLPTGPRLVQDEEPKEEKEEEDEDKKGFVLPPIGWLVAAAVSLLVVLFASIYLSKNPLSSQGNEEVFAQNDPGEAPTKKNRPPVLDLTEDKNTPPPPPPSIGEKTAESDPVLMEEKPLIPSLEDAGRSNNAPAPMRDIPAEEPISEIMGDNSTFDDMDLEDAEADFDVEMEEIAEVVEEAEMEPIDNVFTSEASPTLTSPTSGGAVPKTTITQDGVNGISQRGVSSYNTPYYLENVQTKEKNKLFKKRDRKDEQQSKALENPPSRSLSSSSGTFEQDLNPPRVGNADVRMQDEMISQATGRASYEQQGFAQYSSGNYKGAIKSYEKYLKEDPSNTQARYYLGLSYLEEEKESKALAQFDFILQDESDPYYEDAEWYKAQTLLRMEQKTAAKEELEKIQAKPGKYKSRATESLKDLK